MKKISSRRNHSLCNTNANVNSFILTSTTKQKMKRKTTTSQHLDNIHLYNAHKIANMQKFYSDFHHRAKEISIKMESQMHVCVLMIVGINGKIVLYGLLYYVYTYLQHAFVIHFREFFF